MQYLTLQGYRLVNPPVLREAKTEDTKRQLPKITPEEERAVEQSWLNKADETGTIPWPSA